MRGRRRIPAVLCLVAPVACGDNRPSGEGFDGGSNTYALTVIADADLVVHPAEERRLQVLLTQDQVGPVPNASIHFAFDGGDPAGARIDVPDPVTDAQGVATVSFVAGSTSTDASFRVVASTPGLAAESVSFSFQVLPFGRVLEIVGALNVVPSEGGGTAVVSVGVSGSVGLRVREMDEATGAAIAGDPVRFTLPDGVSSRWSGTVQRSVVVKTGAGGDAQVVLLSAAFAETPFNVTVQSLAGGPPVTFTVIVGVAAEARCDTNAQCAPGQVCAGSPSHCQRGGGASCEPAVPGGCPLGYVCNGGTCEPPLGMRCDPVDPRCTSGYCCDPLRGNTCQPDCTTPCGMGAHCVAGEICGQGACIPDNGTPDVTGTWLTRHDFSLREALPPPVKVFSNALRVLDQSVRGKLTIPGVPGWLESIFASLVGKLLSQYVPDWLQMVLAIGDDLFTVLTNIRAEGSMQLVRNPDLTHLRGTEVWTSIVFYWLPLCGDDIGGDPTQPPECARIDLATTASESPAETARCAGQPLPSISAEVMPFTAALSGGGVVPWTLRLDHRRVKLRMGQVILVLVDQILGFVTPYPCLEEITECSAGPGNCPFLDCNDFGQDAENASGGLLSADLVDIACAGAVRTAGSGVVQLLRDVWTPTADTLEFRGHATVSGTADESACDSGAERGTCAAQIGTDGFETALQLDPARRDGLWDGTFLLDEMKNVPGAWEAVRP